MGNVQKWLRIPQELIDRVQALATDEHRSWPNMASKLIIEGLETRDISVKGEPEKPK